METNTVQTEAEKIIKIGNNSFELVTPVYDGNDNKNMIRKAEKSKENWRAYFKKSFQQQKKVNWIKATNDYKDATFKN
jgi:hypothetical protein